MLNDGFKTGVFLVICYVFAVSLCLGPVAAADEQIAKGEDSTGAKFDGYRQAIQREYGIDIREFKEKLQVGKADGQTLTKYDLNQLLMGIKVELEHTSDKLTALEISTDHLEEFPDYYTRLLKMEEEAEEESEKRAEKEK